MGHHGNLTPTHSYRRLPPLSIPLTMLKSRTPPPHPNYLTHTPPAPPVPHPVSRKPIQRSHLTGKISVPNTVSHIPWKRLHAANLLTYKRASRNANGNISISPLDSTQDSAIINPHNDSRTIGRIVSTTDKINASRTPTGRNPCSSKTQKWKNT